MKKSILLIAVLFLAHCGGPVGPPGPPGPPSPTPTPTPIPTPTPTPVPGTTFEIMGKKIAIKAQMKANPKVSLEEMRASLVATVAQLEGVRDADVVVSE